MTSHKHGLTAKYSFKMTASKVKIWASFEIILFRIAGTLEAETSVIEKPQCLLAIGGEKKEAFWIDLLF